MDQAAELFKSPWVALIYSNAQEPVTWGILTSLTRFPFGIPINIQEKRRFWKGFYILCE